MKFYSQLLKKNIKSRDKTFKLLPTEIHIRIPNELIMNMNSPFDEGY